MKDIKHDGSGIIQKNNEGLFACLRIIDYIMMFVVSQQNVIDFFTSINEFVIKNVVDYITNKLPDVFKNTVLPLILPLTG